MLLDKPRPGTPTNTMRFINAGCCAAKKADKKD
jgi:hypothetical protein